MIYFIIIIVIVVIIIIIIITIIIIFTLNHHSCLISAKRFHQGMSMVNVFCPSIPTIQVHLRLWCLAAAKGSVANEPSRTSHVSRLWIIDPKLSKPDLSESIIDRLCDI
jgi:hypothetical protein